MNPITVPWVLNFLPFRVPGGSILTGDVASAVSSNCVPFGKSEEEILPVCRKAGRRDPGGWESLGIWSLLIVQYAPLTWISV